MTSDTTADYPEPAKEANILPIGNNCTHFSFSLAVLVPGDGLRN